jgi:hypothetical protein
LRRGFAALARGGAAVSSSEPQAWHCGHRPTHWAAW